MDDYSDFTKGLTILYFLLVVLFSLRCIFIDITNHSYLYIPFEVIVILISGTSCMYLTGLKEN